MGSHSIVFFSLLLISSIILASNFESSFADGVIATSMGFENSAILELKNSRGNIVNIDTVRIWLSGDNEFKSFKTEQGWLGKNTQQGVIIFTSQNQVIPGEDVKFGIKTTEKNPIINWKAIDEDGNVITSASTKITISETVDEKSDLGKSDIVGIKNDSVFRLIPDKPSVNSNFRVIGNNFVPGEYLDFYIGNSFDKKIKIDDDGNILFTSKMHDILDYERTEFTLKDVGNNEKKISLRILQLENRGISEIIKLSIGNTPNELKLGSTIILSGMATPSSTLSITSKHGDGEILDIQTIRVSSDGTWNVEYLISPKTGLGQLGIEVSDGKSKILRNVNIISSSLINVSSEEISYQPGDSVHFLGQALPNQNMSIILEDSIGTEVFSRSITVGDTGHVDFDIDISRDAMEGTYVLYLFQGDNEGVTVFGVGQAPEAILFIRTTQLNYSSDEQIKINIQGVPNAQVSLILIDSADREILVETIKLGPDGREKFNIQSGELASGSYTINAKRGESSGDATFTVGFTFGSGNIKVQTTKSDYEQNEQVLILGSTDSTNVLLDLTITNPSGEIIKRVETFSDKFGVFKIDNFRIPADAKVGIWKIDAKSGSNFSVSEFTVLGSNQGMVLNSNKDVYSTSEIVTFTGSGVKAGATVTFKIFNSLGEMIDELNINSKANGEFTTIWKFPDDSIPGEYEIIVDDGLRNTSMKFTLN